MQQIAVALAAARSVTVATNDIAIAYQLAGAEGVALTMIGGTVRSGYYSTQGYLAAHALENLNADKVFIGVDALDVAKGCMITNDAEIQIKKLMLRSARMVIVACDHAKFSQVAFMNLCPLDQVDLIITGSELDPAIARTFSEAGVNLVLV
jgi:DeoR family fructose operon transcriptional repressor